MSNPNQKKQQTVSDYVEKIKSAKALYFVAPTAMNGADSSNIKMKLSSANAVYNVVKNTLFIKSIEKSELKINESTDIFGSGEHAVIFVNSDDIAPSAKTLKEFSTESKKVKILGGYFGKFISSDDVVAIADLPTREVQLGITLGTMMSVPTSFVRASVNNIERFLRVLNAVAEKK